MFVITVPYLDLDKIYESGQAIRWKKLKSKKYVIINGDKAVKVQQQKDRLLFSCSEEEFYSVWFKYFDMKTDYQDIGRRLRAASTELKICSVRAKGIRLIKTDLMESLFTALLIGIGVKNPFAKISLLSTLCGEEHHQSMREDGIINWFAFPCPESILEIKDKLKSQYDINFDYKVNKLIEFCDYIVEGWLNPEMLLECNTIDDVKECLEEYEWFTEESIRYLCLHSSLDIKADPTIDEASKNALEKVVDADCDTFFEWYIEDIHGIVEYVLLYAIYNYNNPPTERELERWERT